MRINITSVLVDDQERAFQFYTTKLGFVVKHDIPMGGPRWLTLVSPEGPDSVELLLEPDNNPAVADAVQTFKRALYDNGIPATSFAVDDVKAEFERLTGLGVRFTMEPAEMGPVWVARFDDTCGNLIQIAG